MIKVNITLARKNFDVRVNEQFANGITGIFGPSGSGKTSLLHSIAGLVKPQQGKISINDHVVFDSENKVHIPVERRHIGYVFQEGRLFPHMTIEKNLLYGHKKNGDIKVHFDEVVDMLKLRHLLRSKPLHISGGERQRTALGRTLLSSPEILLLDEPFSAVDVRLRSQIIPFLLQIHRQIRIPILVVSHELSDLLKLSSHICVMKDGRCLGNADYFHLLKSDEILQLFGESSIVNRVQLQVETVDIKSGLTLLWDGLSGRQIKIKSHAGKADCLAGEQVNFFIAADDIALSIMKPEGLTIQNQLMGTVSDMVNLGSSTICCVDVGFRLTAEVTTESIQRMHIGPGSRVWCLFKAVAIEVAR